MIWPRALPPKDALPDAGPEQARRIVVLESGRTPSGDYLLHPWLRQFGVPVVRADARAPVTSCPPEPGDFWVVVRYLAPTWRRAIEAHRRTLTGLAWFLDDDLLDPAALKGLPTAYGRKILEGAHRQRPWFERQKARWWVSTDALASKYAGQGPLRLPLAPPPELRQPGPAAVRIVYHGSASHQAEMAWLHPVMAVVLGRCESAHFEIIGDLSVNRAFRDLPRTRVLHPMSWDTYCAYTRQHAADIGLAPLLPTVFNAGRGAVKFYDYARMGAVGLFAEGPPYADVVRPGVDGLLLPMQAPRWIESLMALVTDRPRRLAMAQALTQRLATTD